MRSSSDNPPLMYDNYIINLSKRIESQFENIKAEFNFDNGPEFEIALCKVLRLFLPIKYGICRGFVVNSQGNKEGDDIIIFDQERFPTLRLLNKEDFSIKEQIPIEAVYGYIEAKHKLTEESFAKSIEQIIKVKKLCSQRQKMGLYQHDPYISQKPMSYVPESFPNYRNPIFSMVFSRYSEEIDFDENKDDSKVNSFLRRELSKLTKDNILYTPELLIAGKSNFLSTCYVKDGENKPTMFHLGDKEIIGYQVVERKNMAFGIAFAHLMAAIDWIRLGKMPWEEIINESKLYQDSIISNLPKATSSQSIEFLFSNEYFSNGSYIIQHNLGYVPQVSVVNEYNEEIYLGIKKTENEVEISANIRPGIILNGKVIIS